MPSPNASLDVQKAWKTTQQKHTEWLTGVRRHLLTAARDSLRTANQDIEQRQLRDIIGLLVTIELERMACPSGGLRLPENLSAMLPKLLPLLAGALGTGTGALQKSPGVCDPPKK
jgi:hypothetical protein